VEETKTKVKPSTTKAGGSGGSLPVTKPAEKVKPAPGDASVKSADRTPTAANAGKKALSSSNGGKPEESKKEEEKQQSAAEKKREEAEKKK